MHKFKDIINHGYCNAFQTGKCKFGGKCKYEHEINPENKKVIQVIEKKKFNNDKGKDKPYKNTKRTI